MPYLDDPLPVRPERRHAAPESKGRGVQYIGFPTLKAGTARCALPCTAVGASYVWHERRLMSKMRRQSIPDFDRLLRSTYGETTLPPSRTGMATLHKSTLPGGTA